jgi:hypothetical protein
MATPNIGTRRADGKVYAGSHYGYQSPATFNKLKKDGELSRGSETRRNIEQAARPVVRAAQNFQSKFRQATDKVPGIQALEKGVNKASDAAGKTPAARVAQGGSIAADKAARQFNIDPKVAAAALLVGRVAVGGRGGGRASSGSTAPTTRRLPSSARPSGTVRAGSAAPSRALTEARRSVVRPNTSQVARQASGPAHPTSDPRQLAPGNNPARQAPVRSETKRGLKEKAQTQHADMAERGYQGRPRRQPRGQDTSNYLPNRGRVSPTDQGRAAQLRATQEERLAKALEGKRGAERVAARNAFNKEERRRVKDIRRDAIKEAQQYQSAQEAKGFKGSGEKAQLAEADRMGRGRGKPSITRDRKGALAPTQGPRRPTTQTPTTGTRRVAANPESGTNRRGVTGRVVQTKDGDVVIKNNKGNLTNNPGSRTNFDDQKPGNKVAGRTINPATGRPYQPSSTDPTKVSTKQPSASTRQPRGGNPADNFPSRPGRAKMEGEFTNRAGGSPIKTAQTQLREAQLEQRPGLVTRATQKPGQHSGGTGLTRRYQQNASGKQVRHNPDTTQRRNGRKIGRLGQSGQSNVDTPELRKRAAANKARAAASEKPTPTPPKRTPERAAQIRQQSKAATQGTRATRGLTPAQQRALEQKYNRELKNLKDQENTRRRAAGKEPNIDTTHFSGEVRLQGSKYSMNPQASSLVDGSVSRTTGSPKGQGRSSEASTASKKTMEAVRGRQATKAAAEKALKAERGANPRNTSSRTRVSGSGVTKTIKNGTPRNTVSGRLGKRLQEALKILRRR